jgi:hypothetical protein
MENSQVSRERLYTPAIDDKMAQLVAKVAYHTEPEPDGSLRLPDPYFIPDAEAVHIALTDSEFKTYQEFVREDLVLYPHRSLMNVLNLQLRKNQDHARSRLTGDDLAHFPDGFESPKPWLRLAHDITDDPRVQVRYRQTSNMNVQTNYMDRGVLVKLSGLLLGYGEKPVSLIDAGCSRNLIGTKLTLTPRRWYPYLGTQIVRPDENGYPADVDALASLHMHYMMLEDNFPVANVIGIDKQDPMIGKKTREAKMIQKWALNCLYPSERELRLDQTLIEDLQPPTVRFFKGDITDLDHDRLDAEQATAGKADIAYMWTVAYQLCEDGTKSAIENLKPHIKPNGKILIFDYMDVGLDGSLQFSEDWSPYSCKGYVLDLEHEEDGLQQLFTIESARCRKMMLSDYAGRLATRQGFANLLVA